MVVGRRSRQFLQTLKLALRFGPHFVRQISRSQSLAQHFSLGAFATFVAFSWRDRTEEIIPAAEVARLDRANRSARSQALARLRPAR